MLRRLFGKAYSPEELATGLADLALKVDAERDRLVATAAEEAEVDPLTVRKEFLHLQTYLVETAIQSGGGESAPDLQRLFWYQVDRESASLPHGAFLSEHAQRTSAYDQAWVACFENDDSTAFARQLATYCGATGDWLPFVRLWRRSLALGTEVTKFVRRHSR